MFNIKNPNDFLSFFNDAFNDYLAARVLLGNDLISQGAILSSTAIEKYIKALIAMKNNYPHGHLRKAHLNQFKNLYSELYSKLDPEFLLLNQKCYKLRYTESLDKDFNLVIACNEFLSELDHTVMSIHKSFKIEINGKDCKFNYDVFLENNDFRLYADNHVLQDMDKDIFKYSRQRVYEIRMLDSGPLNFEYNTDGKPTSYSFLREGCIKNNTIITTSFPQLQTEKV